MVGFPAARMTDPHTCPICMGAPLPILPPCALTVMIGGLPAARQTDLCTCIPPPVPDMIAFGSPTVMIQKLPAARMLDPTAKGGMILLGHVQTLIGIVGVPSVVLPSGLVVQQIQNPDGSVSLKVGGNIVVQGPIAFQMGVARDLDRLNGTPTGKGLISALQSSGRNLTIRQGSPPVTGYDAPADRFKRPDGSAGPGTDATITITGNAETLEDGSEPWMNTPSEVVLGHEMIHAEQAQRGQITPGKTAGVNNRETEAVGLPPYQNNPYTENKIRKDLGYPARKRY